MSSASNAGTQFSQHALTDDQLPFLFGIGSQSQTVLFAETVSARFSRASQLIDRVNRRRFRVGAGRLMVMARRQLQKTVFKNGFRRGVEASTFERREGRLGRRAVAVLTAERVDRDDSVWSREVLVRFLATVVSHVRISSYNSCV
jgi:hypothetical protein